MTEAPVITIQPVDLQREYAAGSSGLRSYRNAIQALPHTIDELERELGDTLYTRMMTDPRVRGDVRLLTAAVVQAGVSFAPAEAPHGDDAAAQAATDAAQFAWRCMDNLSISLPDVLRDMVQAAFVYGSKIAEQVYAPGEDEDAGRLMLTAIKPKPRRRTAFAVDAFDNVIGILAAEPGRSLSLGTVVSGANILPREKFAVLAHEIADSDPRGTTLLRAAYNFWWIKTQILPELLKFAAQFGTPSLVGTTPERATSSDPTKTPQQELLDELLDFQNGTALSTPFGTLIKVIEAAQNGGETFFERMIDLCDRQISTAILGVTRATQEAQSGSRADSDTAKDLFDNQVAAMQQRVAAMLQHDVIAPLMALNNPMWAQYPPIVSVGGTTAEDRSSAWAAAAQLARAGYLDASQLTELDTLLGLPPRNAEEVEARRGAVPAPEPEPEDEEDGQ